jgi:uncharacterized protein (TIGR02594 family)
MAQLPEQYNWLIRPDAPQVIKEALIMYGTVEFKGAADNPLILAWAKEIGSKAGIEYDHDEIPWCGLFVAVRAKRAGFPLPAIAVRASSWDAWGQAADKPRLGDVLRFQRPGGGHVGFYVGEDATAYHVLGGNQGDAVTISRLTKDRCVAVRRAWPVSPATVPVFLKPTGKVSENEA